MAPSPAMPISKQTARREVNVPSQSVVLGSDKGSVSGRKERGKGRNKNLRKELVEKASTESTDTVDTASNLPKVTQPETPSDLAKKKGGSEKKAQIP